MRRHSTEPHTVALTVRALTSDGADVRILVEAEVRPAVPTPVVDVERATHALVVPALERWVGRRTLTSLSVELDASLSGVAATLRDELGHLGTDLLRLEIAAVEHLIRSPSAPCGDGPR